MEKDISKYRKIALDFASKDKYDGCRFEKEWNGYYAFMCTQRETKGLVPASPPLS